MDVSSAGHVCYVTLLESKCGSKLMQGLAENAGNRNVETDRKALSLNHDKGTGISSGADK